MSLKLIDQYQQAVLQPDFRHRISAAMFVEARTQLAATADPDPTVEKQRLAEISRIFHSVADGVDLFAWAVVSDATVSTVDDLTDAKLASIVHTVFIPVAKQYTVPT